MSESAWLIERTLPQEVKYRELWLCFENGHLRWSNDTNKAIRFPRKEDAENCWHIFKWQSSDLLADQIYRNVQAVEHMWINENQEMSDRERKLVEAAREAVTPSKDSIELMRKLARVQAAIQPYEKE